MSAATFRATVIPAGKATGAEVPAEVVEALGAGKRTPVKITINGHTWRSRIASKGGRFLVGISAANRDAAQVVEGGEIEVSIEPDTAPREVDEPPERVARLDFSMWTHTRAIVCTWLRSAFVN